MFGIAIRDIDGVVHYWTGGTIFSVHAEEAVRFHQEIDAETSIPFLKIKGSMRKSAHVAPLPDEE